MSAPERPGYRYTGRSGDGQAVYEPWPPPYVIRRDTPNAQLSNADLLLLLEDNGPEDMEFWDALDEIKARLTR